MPTETETETIISLWNEGRSYGYIAKSIGYGKSTVQNWIKKLINNGTIEPKPASARTNTDKATTYSRDRRINLNDKFLKIVEARLAANPSNRDLKALATTYGIMVDKREIMEPHVPLTREDDGLMSAMETKTDEVWKDVNNYPVQVDSTKRKAMENTDLVG